MTRSEGNVKLEFKRLNEVDCSEYIDLNTNPLVRRQMPLTSDKFDEEDCKEWIVGKEKMWEEHGYGPWAFVVDGKFAGWGGLQPEDGDADLGLVLRPDYWGYGKLIYEEIIRRAFEEMRLESVTILFPPTRTRVKGIQRLGFQPDGEVKIAGERFIRYRLYAPTDQRSTS
jgi:[ribosomal protein S5]-alanine N-acetyltransferase